MKNVLIPTDFTTSSVQLAVRTVKVINEKVNIVFFHAFDLPYFYNDLLSSEPPYISLMNEKLRQACRYWKDQYPDLIGTITFKFMRGNSNALFRNFIDANNIDIIVCPKEYQYTKVHEDSLNPVGFFKRSKLPLLQDFAIPGTRYIVKEKTAGPKPVIAS